MYQFGQQIFLSYRGQSSIEAERLRDWLLCNQDCQSAILFPRNVLTSEREMLLAFEYFELIEVILDELAASQTFVLLDEPGYWSSYFTQIELTQWRRLSKNNPPQVYQVRGVERDGRPTQGQWVQLEPMTSEQKCLFAGISAGTSRRMQRLSHLPFTAWSTYARNCFLVCCAGCGEYLLLSQNVVYRALHNGESISCPHQKPHYGSKQIGIREEASQGNFYRKPLIQEQSGTKEPHLLSDWEIIHLLMNNDSLPTIPVITLAGETMHSDLQKPGMLALGAGVLATGSLLVHWLRNDP
jgi:hypothetical protein